MILLLFNFCFLRFCKILYNIIFNFFFFLVSLLILRTLLYVIFINFYFSHTFEVTSYAHVCKK